jgi:hypothetical protein
LAAASGHLAVTSPPSAANFTVADAVAALSRCGGDTERAIRSLLHAVASENGLAGRDAPVPGRRARGVKAERGFDGAAPPPAHQVKVEPSEEGEGEVKTEPIFAEPVGANEG